MSGIGRGRFAALAGPAGSGRREVSRRDRSHPLGALTGLRADGGNAPLELILLAPVILMLIGLVVAAGRVSTARNAVDAAAREAARQASVATSQATARQAAISGASSALAADDLQCQPTVRLLNLSQAFNTPVGVPADIRVRVTCVVQLSDLLVPGVPGSITLNAIFTSPLDPYRSRNLAYLGGCHALVTPRAPHSAAKHTSMGGAGCDEIVIPGLLTVSATPVRSP